MTRRRLTIALTALALLSILFAGIQLANALTAEVGQQVIVKATASSGVPVHRVASSSLMGRVPDGSKGTVLELNATGTWLRVQFPTITGWITSTYVTQVITPLPTTEIEVLKATIEQLNNQIVGLRTQVQTLTHEKATLDNELSEAQAALSTAQQQIETLTHDNTTLLNERTALQAEVAALKVRVTKLEADLATALAGQAKLPQVLPEIALTTTIDKQVSAPLPDMTGATRIYGPAVDFVGEGVKWVAVLPSYTTAKIEATPSKVGTFRTFVRWEKSTGPVQVPIKVTVQVAAGTVSIAGVQVGTDIRVTWSNIPNFSTADRIEVWAPGATGPSDTVQLASPQSYVVIETLAATGSLRYNAWTDPTKRYTFRYYQGTTLIAESQQVAVQ